MTRSHEWSSFSILDEPANRDTLVVMPSDEIKIITRAYNKIFAVLFDPDVREVFGNGCCFQRGDPLPEIQVDESEKNTQDSS